MTTNSRFIIVVFLLLFSMEGMADCNSDYRTIMQYRAKADQEKKAGRYSAAERLYKRGARKLAALKYRCTTMSLKLLTAKEREFRQLAQSVKKSAPQVSSSAEDQAKHGRQKKSRKGKLLPVTPARTVRKKTRRHDARTGRRGIEKSAKSRRERRNSCLRKKLAHIVRIEQHGYRALQDQDIGLAIRQLTLAADLYDKESSVCRKVRARLAVIDRAKRIRMRLESIKNRYGNCDEKYATVQSLVRQADNDENSGEYELAQEGYIKAAQQLESMPPHCRRQNYLADIAKYRAKVQLFACKPYLNGMKFYNLAFNEMAKAEKKSATKHFREAALHFTHALQQCRHGGINRRLIQKLRKYSELSIRRMKR